MRRSLSLLLACGFVLLLLFAGAFFYLGFLYQPPVVVELVSIEINPRLLLVPHD